MKEYLITLNNLSAVICSSYELNPTKFDWIPSKLILCFDDTTNERRERAFTRDIAHRIKSHIDGLDSNTILYFCCDSGQSRSTALAAATYRYLRKDEMIIWRDPYLRPNTLVYSMMCEAYGYSVNSRQLYYRKYINERAISREIRKSRKNLH